MITPPVRRNLPAGYDEPARGLVLVEPSHVLARQRSTSSIGFVQVRTGRHRATTAPSSHGGVGARRCSPTSGRGSPRKRSPRRLASNASMGMPETLRKLLTAAGPSGYEQAPAAVFREAASAFAEVTYDTVGSTVARVPGTGEGRSVAIVGHIDEIGLIVHHIDDDGFLWFTGVGGWDPIVLVGQRVEIATRAGRVPGVVGKKPIHLMKDEDRKKVPQLKDLHIDIGAAGGDEAREPVRIGDVAVIAGEPVELPGDRFVSRSMDNRIGCFVALEAARLVAEAGGAPGDVYAVAVAQEEITFGGARTTAYSLRPDVAIAVDVTFATDQPGHLRAGARPPQVRQRPGARRAARRWTRRSSSCCTRRARPRASRSPSTASARGTGTDADAIHISRAGIPTRRRLGAAALHALAGRDGAARRRRERGEADRGVRAAAAARHRLPPLKPLLLLFDIDGTLLQRASIEHALALRDGGGCGARRRRAGRRRRRVRGPHRPRDRARSAGRRRA